MEKVNSTNWHNYNESQTKEKILFMRLLRELCSLIEEPKHQVGRKPVVTKDMIYALALKTYLTYSSRRSCGDIKLATKAGYLEKSFHFNTLLKYLEDQRLKPLIKELIEISALPLKQVEIDFAVDSTGFGTSKFVRWFDIRIQKSNLRRNFKKCHAICGVTTNIVTSVEVSESYSHDSKYFDKLVTNTANNFKIEEVSADKAYCGRANVRRVSELGGIAYIPFKINATGKADGSLLWARLYKHFKENREEFMDHYHKRSNIESTFSMIKSRFGQSIRCKKQTSQENEILLKVLCHNICVLTQEIFLNNLDVDFKLCAKSYTAHK